MVQGDAQISEAELAAVRALDAPAPARLRALLRPEPSPPPSRPHARHDGTELRHLRRGGQTIVTWLRAGHAGVFSGTRLSRDELLELAAWNGSMDIARIHTRLSPTPFHRLAA
jgi:hypothetical protein